MRRLKFIVLVMAGVCTFSQSESQNKILAGKKKLVGNIESFAKLYGYVRYFHPSDEASAIDWNQFAAYGIKEVEKDSDKNELLATLRKLFKPIAPSVLIYPVNDSIQFDVKNITPPAKEGYQEIYWQYLGFSGEVGKSVYKSVRVNRSNALPIFSYKPSVDKPFYADLGNDIHCTVPLMLYGTDKQTYPAADNALLNSLQNKLKKLNTGYDVSVEYADLVVYYNAMKHFFPYFDVIKTDWDRAFYKALMEVAFAKSNDNFRLILERFSAKLHDGYGRVSSIPVKGLARFSFSVPIQIEWIENKLIVTKVLDTSCGVVVGTEIKKMQHVDIRRYYDSSAQYISASTKGWLQTRLNTEILYGPDTSKMVLDVVLPSGTEKTVSISRTITPEKYYAMTTNRTKHKKINDSTYYMNLDKISMNEIDSLMPELLKAKYVICDLRGFPNNNRDFISHLLTANDTCKTWMRLPEIIYPNYTVSGFQTSGLELKTEKPHLNAKIVFITGGGAISDAESYMGLIQGYKLATIVGQPTAGTSGEVNQIYLPGGYYITFAGTKVVKLEGSQLYGLGIIPDVPVSKTVKGVMEGKDEFLEKAIEVCKP